MLCIEMNQIKSAGPIPEKRLHSSGSEQRLRGSIAAHIVCTLFAIWHIQKPQARISQSRRTQTEFLKQHIHSTAAVDCGHL